MAAAEEEMAELVLVVRNLEETEAMRVAEQEGWQLMLPPFLVDEDDVAILRVRYQRADRVRRRRAG